MQKMDAKDEDSKGGECKAAFEAWGEGKRSDDAKDNSSRETKSVVREEKTTGPPIDDGKVRPIKTSSKHWSTTPEGRLVARATAFVYRSIVASKEENGCGLKEFFEEHCLIFEKAEDSSMGVDEMKLETWSLYKEYEGRIEKILSTFAAGEGCEPPQLMSLIRNAADSIPQAEKSVQTLLAATEFRKFVRLMRMKAAAFRKDEAAQAAVRAMAGES